MVKRRQTGRRLRSLWATLTVLCLVGAGAAYGLIRFQQSELEFRATTHARDLSQDVLGPVLEPEDLGTPAHGARYAELIDVSEQRVLKGPIDEVRIWGLDGTVLFADDQTLVGEQYPAAVEFQPAISGATRSEIDGGRFRTFTWTRVGKLRELVVVEIARPYAAIAHEAQSRWQPWVPRALTGAMFFGLLWIGTAAAFAFVPALRRREQPAPPKPAFAPEYRPEWNPTMPEYMRPGFREEVESRRRMEQEIIDVRQERDDLIARLQRAQRQREQAEAASSMSV